MQLKVDLFLNTRTYNCIDMAAFTTKPSGADYARHGEIKIISDMYYTDAEILITFLNKNRKKYPFDYVVKVASDYAFYVKNGLLWPFKLAKIADDLVQKDAINSRTASPSIRFKVLRRDGYKCVICGKGAIDGVKLEIDHIIPYSQGGKTKLSNLQTLCFECNRGKGTKPMYV